MAITAGIYELRSMLSTVMTVTGSGYSPVKGSNVFLYTWNDGNNRKWRLTQGSNGRWRLQNLANGLYMTLGANSPANGVNVRQWTGSSNAIQYWNIIEAGETADFEGYECPVVRLGSYATADGATWMLDVDGAMAGNNANMEINRTSSAASQTFLLVPSESLNNSYSAPASAGWTRNTAGNPFTTVGGADIEDMKLGWLCANTWMPGDGRFYERRTRRRLMDAATSAWGAWGQWDRWQTVDPFVRGQYCYDLNVIDASFDADEAKALEIGYEVRARTATAHGPRTAKTVRSIVDPAMTLTVAGASMEGFLVDVASDYAPAYFTVTSIAIDGVELLEREIAAEVLGPSVQVTLPWSSFKSLPEPGSSAAVTYRRGTDLVALFSGQRTAELVFDYGESPATAPSFEPAAGMTLDVTHPDGIAGVWTAFGDGVYGDGDGRAVVYPFGKPYQVLVALGDGTLYYEDREPEDVRPAHAWTWEGGSLILGLSSSALQTSRTVKPGMAEFELNGREWHAASYSGTLDGEFTAAGVLADGLTESTVDDLVALARAGDAIYRAPSGEMAYVAVTGVQYQTTSAMTEANVTMIQVSR